MANIENLKSLFETDMITIFEGITSKKRGHNNKFTEKEKEKFISKIDSMISETTEVEEINLLKKFREINLNSQDVE